MQAALKNIQPLAHRRSGFTIVELLVVIVVIGILASITIVAFNGVQQSAGAAVLKSDLRNAQSQLEIANISNGSYPADTSEVRASSGTVFEYTNSGSSYCITASSAIAATSFYIDSLVGVTVEGACAGHTGGISPPSALSSNVGNACAFIASEAYCWGNNPYGNLGNNSIANSSSPVAVVTSGVLNGLTVTRVSNGGNHACAVANAAAYCWGWNIVGQLGNNTTTDSSVPVAVSTSGVLLNRTVTAISASNAAHTCALADASVFCWGIGSNGRLGNGSSNNSPVPVTVTTGILPSGQVTAISSGGTATCALANGSVFCWGSGALGQLGNGGTANSTVPVAVTTGVLPAGQTTAISAGAGDSSCALANGNVFCWGGNGSGQHGNGLTANSTVPVAATTTGALSGQTITDISVGSSFACGVADVQTFCWGLNNVGQLGNGTTNGSLLPVPVSPLP
jgi:prepilin-type N-terminal cleavage/methylation domain-containing protein